MPPAVAFLNYWTIRDFFPNCHFSGVCSCISERSAKLLWAGGWRATPGAYRGQTQQVEIKAGTGRVNTPFTQWVFSNRSEPGKVYSASYFCHDWAFNACAFHSFIQSFFHSFIHTILLSFIRVLVYKNSSGCCWLCKYCKSADNYVKSNYISATYNFSKSKNPWNSLT